MNPMKQLGEGLRSQSRSMWRLLFFLYIPVCLLFLLVGLLSRVLDDLTLSLLMRDLVITARLPVFAGFVPQVEAILWSASLTVCILTWVVLRRRGGEFDRSKRFLLQFGILTAVLMVDDIFLFHGEIAPKQLNIDKNIVIAAYLVMVCAFVYSSRREILSSEYLLLTLALGLFAVSILLDALPLQYLSLPRLLGQFRFFLEDGFKFAGTATWLTYFFRYAVGQIEKIADAYRSRL